MPPVAVGLVGDLDSAALGQKIVLGRRIELRRIGPMMPGSLLLPIALLRGGRTYFAFAFASSGGRGGRQNETDNRDLFRSRRRPFQWRS